MTKKAALLSIGGAAVGGLGAWMAARALRPGADLNGRVVLITGGSRGLGLQLAREFAAEGCRVAICARDAQELDRASSDIQRSGAPVHTVQCDVTRRDEVERAVNEVTEHFGRIDILVNNAGIIQVGPVETMRLEDFENAMAVMFWGSVYPTLAVLPQMRQRRDGRIVNVTSIGGKVSVPHLVPYSCAKFAHVAFSEGLRSELAPHGISVTTIVPGLMRTGSYLHALFKGRQANEYTWFSLGSATPLAAISAGRAARSIVRAAKRGDAEAILSVPAQIFARLHGAVPEITLPIMELINRIMLPSSEGGSDHLIEGHEAERQLNSKIHRGLTTMGRSAARNLNEAPQLS
jgi:NAD(P)-dependent dehydrogenase (short-subunit alcohol dehydrogenase family)